MVCTYKTFQSEHPKPLSLHTDGDVSWLVHCFIAPLLDAVGNISTPAA